MDVIEERFLKKLWEMTDIRYENQIAGLNQQRDIVENKIAEKINAQMKVLLGIYENSTENPPRYLIISYLRSSLLDGYPWYKLILLDEDYFCSGYEYSAWLDAPMLVEYLSSIMNMVNEEFQKQMRVETYHVDQFLMVYGEKFNLWMVEHIFEIIRKHLMSDRWEDFYIKNKMHILIGDYRNEVSSVFDWRVEVER